jgi:hypothetical protein
MDEKFIEDNIDYISDTSNKILDAEKRIYPDFEIDSEKRLGEIVEKIINDKRSINIKYGRTCAMTAGYDVENMINDIKPEVGREGLYTAVMECLENTKTLDDESKKKFDSLTEEQIREGTEETDKLIKSFVNPRVVEKMNREIKSYHKEFYEPLYDTTKVILSRENRENAILNKYGGRYSDKGSIYYAANNKRDEKAKIYVTYLKSEGMTNEKKLMKEKEKYIKLYDKTKDENKDKVWNKIFKKGYEKKKDKLDEIKRKMDEKIAIEDDEKKKEQKIQAVKDRERSIELKHQSEIDDLKKRKEEIRISNMTKEELTLEIDDKIKKAEADKLKEVVDKGSIATTTGVTAITGIKEITEKVTKGSSKSGLVLLILIGVVVLVIIITIGFAFLLIGSIWGMTAIVKNNPNIKGIPRRYLMMYGCTTGWGYVGYSLFKYGWKSLI